MNKTKRVFWGFLSLDYKAMETYLEEMSEKGWMLEKVGVWTAKFRAMEPKKLKFHVDVFKEGGPLTPENTKDAEEYRNLCKESGWNFITSKDFLQFFYAEEGESPTPLQTDDDLEQKVVRSTLGKWEIISVIFVTVISIRLMILYFPTKYRFMLSFVGVAGILFPLMLVSVIAPVIYGLVRMLKARRNIERGLPIEKPTLEDARKRMKVIHGSTLIIFILIALAFIADSFFRPGAIALSLTGPTLGIATGLILRFFIKKKSKDKKDSVLYVTFAILGVLFVSAIANSIFGRFNIDSGYKHDTVPEGYPAISITELLDSSQQGVLIHSEFNPGASPMVPKHYSYTETWESNGVRDSINIKYYNTIHPRLAERIFHGIVAELREGIKWKGMRLFQKTVNLDEKMRVSWGVNNLAFTEDKDEIILQKGKIVVHLYGNKTDFEDRHIKETIMDGLFVD